MKVMTGKSTWPGKQKPIKPKAKNPTGEQLSVSRGVTEGTPGEAGC